ncbi:hypothetical protein [Pedobacter metabolipauper]|uniref:Uncharacterized protein n=1 Tax=Pedobacter metabolipauper TaxID=425513 RepID=A0A4R6SX61_9SPHI|nr:hypothetical protein [Pedobacter metabolipauper]TDQ09224.1 hypothetical protein ATK78_1378 [Pedobacter metabolipauper]
MKIIQTVVVIIIVFIMNFNGLAQEQIPIKSVISSLPKGSERIFELKTINIAVARNPIIHSNSKVGEIYKIGNVLVKINAASGKMSEDHLEETKKSMDYQYRGLNPAFYKSDINFISNYKVWIRQSEFSSADIGEIMTSVVNKTSNKIVVVVMSYEKREREIALKTLDSILQNIKM